jgi:hypothetical protein
MQAQPTGHQDTVGSRGGWPAREKLLQDLIAVLDRLGTAEANVEVEVTTASEENLLERLTALNSRFLVALTLVHLGRLNLIYCLVVHSLTSAACIDAYVAGPSPNDHYLTVRGA